MPSDFAAADFFILRVPALPVETVKSLSAGLQAASTFMEGGEVIEALKQDREVARQNVRRLLTPRLIESIRIAAPAFAALLEDRLAENSTDDRMYASAYRYLVRAATRPAPFGLFASLTQGKVGRRDAMRIGASSTHVRRSFFDAAWLAGIAAAAPRGAARMLHANDTARKTPFRYRFFEPAAVNSSQHHVEVERNEFVDLAFATAQQSVSARDVAEAVAAAASVTDVEALAFVEELAAAGLLIWENAPRATAADHAATLATDLEMSGARDLSARIAAAQGMLRSIDREAPFLGNADRYESIRAAIGVPPPSDALVHSDAWIPPDDVEISAVTVANILEGVEKMRALFGWTKHPQLATWRDRFSARYGDRAIPLLEALDDEEGVGFGDEEDAISLLETFPAPRVADEEPGIAQLISADPGRREVVLTEEFVERAKKKSLPLPDSFAVFGRFARRQGDGPLLMHVDTITGPSGASTIGRFCRGNEALTEAVRRYLAEEERLRPNAVFAEIVYLPPTAGNIVSRPVLRDYEIPILTPAGVPKDRVIALRDLFVHVEEGRIVMHSKSLQREIVPRLTSAHAYVNAGTPAPYRFLARLQEESVCTGLTWNWSGANGLSFLPRVRFKNTVLSLARWRLEIEDARNLTEAKLSAAALFTRVQKLRERLGLPRYVLSDDLTIDLENPFALDNLVRNIRRSAGKAIELREPFPNFGESPVGNDEGTFMNEFVIPFTRTRSVARASVRPLNAVDRKSYLPGSEWLFVKIYTGRAMADDLLCKEIAPLVTRLLTGGDIDQWFFVRYSDPHWHLRLRLRGEPGVLMSRVLPSIRTVMEPFVNRGIWKIVVDTYEPEYRRYGGAEGVALAHEIFAIDSEMASALLEHFARAEDRDLRWKVALEAVDRLFSDFGVSLAERVTVTEKVHAGLCSEEPYGPELKTWLQNRFRGLKTDVIPEAISAQLARRSTRLAPVCDALRDATRAGRISISLAESAAHHSHMSLNRLLRSRHRNVELVLTYILARRAKTVIARTM